MKRYALAGLSLACLLFVLIPPADGYGVPISFELADRHLPAWLLFCFLGIALAYLAVRFWRQERPFSALFCATAVVGLGAIASTDPESPEHLAAFLLLSGSMLAWMWSIASELEDSRLRWAAAGASIGAFLCFAGNMGMGVGERVMLMSALGGMNVLFYDYVIM